MGTQPIKLPQLVRRRDERAIQGLYEFIHELGEYDGERLTDKQKVALIRVAEGLISSIQAEMRVRKTAKRVKRSKQKEWGRDSWALERPSLNCPYSPPQYGMKYV